MMNSIRPDALASLLLKGEAETGKRPVKRERQFRDLSLESTVSSTATIGSGAGAAAVLGGKQLGQAVRNAVKQGQALSRGRP
jgi:hypothetical protein